MRFIHLADLHLGRTFNGISLEDDHASILDQIVDAIAVHRADALVIAGDIFDRAVPPTSAVRQFNTFLTRVAHQTTAAVVMIAGNHDSGDRIDSMSIMTNPRRALIRGPLVANEMPLVLEDNHGKVVFSALPFAYEYAARECFGDDSIATPEDVLRAQIAAARVNVPAGARWVVVAHAFVAGATSSDVERPLGRAGGIETVRPEIFEGAHYVALGHLHRPQNIARDRIRYAGAPLAFGFDESDEPKSMSIVDLDAAGVTTVTAIDFVPRRRVRVLRGKLAELVTANRSMDFIKAVLTDSVPLIDPMKKIREVFPHACALEIEREERAPELKSASSRRLDLNDPIKVVGDFIEYVRDEVLSESESALVSSTLHDLQREENVQ